ncbi:MAG TPA: hypothetical protein VMZ51_09090 [Acidimicrobiales bacterium]|nr:hypothetical protein [Acidimicrobiales bacterium]
MRFQKIAAAGLTGGLLLIGAAPSWAQTTPAPPGSAEAVAAEVDGLVSVAHTKAEANPDPTTSTATANALEVGGNPPLAQLGSKQTGEGEQNNALLEFGDLNTTGVKVAPSSARVTRDGGNSSSTARAALLRLVLINPGLLAIDVLQSFSEANYTSTNSTGTGSSDGVAATIAGQRVNLLHTEASTANGGKSYVIGVNGLELITNNDVGQTTKIIDIPGILRLNAVSVDGGAGSGLVKASAVDAAVANVPAVLSGVTAAGSAQPVGAAAPAELGAGDTGAGGGGSGLPRTGFAVGGLLFLGAGLIGAGALVARSCQRAHN